MQVEDWFRRIADEIEAGQQDRALWAWALAESGGDAEKTKALYIRRRFAALTAAAPSRAVQPDTELHRLRVELRRQLALQQKKSLYTVLGVPADSSDAEIAGAIGRIRAAATPLDAETAYAIEALGDPQARERADRRLMEQLRKRPTAVTVDAPIEPAAATVGGGLKLLAAAVLALGLGYLGLSYSKGKAEHELRLKEAELRKGVVERTAEIADRVVDNQKSAIDASVAAQERAAEAQDRTQLEARMRDDKYRLDQAYRQEQQVALADQRRQQMEQFRLQAEARRRDAEAAASTRAIRQQAIQDAIARGNLNEAQRLRNQPY